MHPCASICIIHSSLNQGEKVAVSVRLVRNVAPTRHMFLGAVWVICNTSYHVKSMLDYCTNNFYEELPLREAESASNTLNIIPTYSYRHNVLILVTLLRRVFEALIRQNHQIWFVCNHHHHHHHHLVVLLLLITMIAIITVIIVIITNSPASNPGSLHCAVLQVLRLLPHSTSCWWGGDDVWYSVFWGHMLGMSLRCTGWHDATTSWSVYDICSISECDMTSLIVWFPLDFVQLWEFTRSHEKVSNYMRIPHTEKIQINMFLRNDEQPVMGSCIIWYHLWRSDCANRPLIQRPLRNERSWCLRENDSADCVQSLQPARSYEIFF